MISEMLKNCLDHEEESSKRHERYSIYEDYLGLSNLLSNVKVSDDNPLLYGSRPLFERTRRSSGGSDNMAVLSPTIEQQRYFTDLNKNSLVPPSWTWNQKSQQRDYVGFNNNQTENPNHQTALLQSPPSPTNNFGRSQQPVQVCVFCRNNGESENIYKTHNVKDSEGKTECPILRAYTCPICKANGDNSHTIKYCPLNQNGRMLNNAQRNFQPFQQHSVRPSGFRLPVPNFHQQIRKTR